MNLIFSMVAGLVALYLFNQGDDENGWPVNTMGASALTLFCIINLVKYFGAGF